MPKKRKLCDRTNPTNSSYDAYVDQIPHRDSTCGFRTSVRRWLQIHNHHSILDDAERPLFGYLSLWHLAEEYNTSTMKFTAFALSSLVASASAFGVPVRKPWLHILTFGAKTSRFSLFAFLCPNDVVFSHVYRNCVRITEGPNRPNGHCSECVGW